MLFYLLCFLCISLSVSIVQCCQCLPMPSFSVCGSLVLCFVALCVLVCLALSSIVAIGQLLFCCFDFTCFSGSRLVPALPLLGSSCVFKCCNKLVFWRIVRFQCDALEWKQHYMLDQIRCEFQFNKRQEPKLWITFAKLWITQ